MQRHPRSNAKLTRWRRSRTLADDAVLFVVVVVVGGTLGLIIGTLF